MVWCDVESDPAVFRELIARFGVKGVGVEEIYDLSMKADPSFGLILLFKYIRETDDREVTDPDEFPELFFAKQVVTNACATQAILSVLLNAEGIELGSELNDFKSFASGLDSESRGIAIGNSDHLRVAHNSFARPEPFMSEETRAYTGKGDVYHFIAYLPFRDPVTGKWKVFELDGLKRGPILIGEVEDTEDWLSIAKPAIQARMNRYSASEVDFALLSIQEERSIVLKRELETLQAKIATLDSANGKGGEGLGELQSTIESLHNSLEDEAAKQESQRKENVRRRHNYIPFAIHLLRALSSKGKLSSMVTKAKEQPRKKARGS